MNGGLAQFVACGLFWAGVAPRLRVMGRLVFGRVVIRLAVGVALGLLVSGTASAGLNQWTTNGPVVNGSAVPIIALAIDPQTPSTVYAGGSAGLFKSTDSGGSWTLMNAGLPMTPLPIAIDPQTPTTLYVGPVSTGGVYKSVDGAESWVPVNNGLTVNGVLAVVTSLAIDPQTPTTVHAGALIAVPGVFKSTDAGSSWTAMNTGLTNRTVTSLAIDPKTPTTLYAGTSSTVFKSMD